jgi:hypothetical protein
MGAYLNGYPAPNLIDARSAALALLSLLESWLDIKGYKVGSFIVINGLVGAQ